MVVQILRVAFVLRRLRHLHKVALAAFQEALRVGLFQPFVIVRQPVEQVVVVDVHHAVRRLLQRVADVIGPVHVVHGVFAVVAEVEILDGVVDGDELLSAVEHLVHGRMLVCVLTRLLLLNPFDLHLHLGLIFVKGVGELVGLAMGEVEGVAHPVPRLPAPLPCADRGGGLAVAHVIGEIVHTVIGVGDAGVREEAVHDLRDGGFPVHAGVALVIGGEGVAIPRGELAGVFHMVRGEIPLSGVQNVEMDAREEIRGLFGCFVCCHDGLLSVVPFGYHHCIRRAGCPPGSWRGMSASEDFLGDAAGFHDHEDEDDADCDAFEKVYQAVRAGCGHKEEDVIARAEA